MGEEPKTNFLGMTDIDLVNIVNESERLGWRMNHDASHGRIEGNIDNSLSEIYAFRDQAVDEIKKRTGLKSHEDLIKYIQGKLKDQDVMWDKQWEQISKEGTVFNYKENEKTNKPSHVFETVRAYLPVKGVLGSKQYVLTRIHGEREKFYLFDDRDVPQLQLLNINPIYFPENSGIIKHDEKLEQRLKLNPNSRRFYDFSEGGTIFSHAGFNGLFETYGHFNLFGKDNSEKNEIILARPHTHDWDIFFYEFTPRDLGAMTKIPMEPKFNKNKHSYFFRLLDLS